ASYKNMFRMPTFNELYFDNYGTIDLKPEITDQINAGLTFSAPRNAILKDLTVTADGYLNLIKDKIVAIPYNLFKWTMTNLGKVRIWGIDVNINSEIGITGNQSVVASLSYSYQRAQTRTSPDKVDWMKQVAYTPLNSGSFSLSWLNPWVSVAVHGNAVSARYTTNANLPSTRIPGYADFGAAIFHTFNLRKGSLELRADIINLFDKQYQIVARYPMPGRSWAASVRYFFH
ncbi:MAG: TonB-dependent receptor, partial [Muribaculaceae bacterium]|nr:TonB-dependent receptor [Muribaculaceae bacterium]